MGQYDNVELARGVYDTPRAAALAGVPARTLHYWARNGIYRPSIAPGPRTRLWSWGDLLAIRAIDWFRRDKGVGEPARVSMAKIRRMLETIEAEGASREKLHQLVAVSRGGNLFLTTGDDYAIRADGTGQVAVSDFIRPVSPYLGGPDLLEPRPLLRIIPGKLHGEPHVRDTRIATALLYRLIEMGYPEAAIREMYPSVTGEALNEAIDLEQSLRQQAA